MEMVAEPPAGIVPVGGLTENRRGRAAQLKGTLCARRLATRTTRVVEAGWVKKIAEGSTSMPAGDGGVTCTGIIRVVLLLVMVSTAPGRRSNQPMRSSVRMARTPSVGP